MKFCVINVARYVTKNRMVKPEACAESLPPEVLYRILSHLSATDVCRGSTVSRTWNEVAKDNQLWKIFYIRDVIENLQAGADNSQYYQTLSQGCSYKSLYMHYIETRKRWMSGKRVTTHTDILLTSTGAKFNGNCLAITGCYIIATKPEEDNDNKIYVFSSVMGKYIHQLIGLYLKPVSIFVLKNQKVVAAHANSFRACVWNIENGACLRSFNFPIAIKNIVMHKNLLAVSLSERDHTLLLSIESGQQLIQLDCSDVCLMDDQHMVVHNYFNSVLQLWDVEIGSHLFAFSNKESFNKMLLDKETHSLVGLNRHAVSVWDTETGTHKGTVHASQNDINRDMVIHDGRAMVAFRWTRVTPYQQKIMIINLQKSPSILCSIIDGPICPHSPLFHINVVCRDMLIVPSHRDKYINLWDMKNHRFVRNMALNCEGKIVGINANINQLLVVLVNTSSSRMSLVRYDFSS